MPLRRANDRLPSEDAAFLYLENERTPLHIGSVSIFEGTVPLGECIDFVASKLRLLPRYRQRLVVPPFHAGHPTWEYDPKFDIRQHIHNVRLKCGTEGELREVAANIFSRIMDRQKPLWDLTLVDGLKDGRGALIARVHHCLADGLAGIGIMNVILDSTPHYRRLQKKKSFRAPPLPDASTSLVDALITSSFDFLQRILRSQAAALELASAVVTDGEQQRALWDLLRFMPELLSPVQRLPFNESCLGPRKVAWHQIPMSEVQAIREVFGGTLNDVVLTIVTLAIGRYAQSYGIALQKRLLRVMVPVNLRQDETGSQPGNRVSMFPIGIPLDVRDPVKLLGAIRKRTDSLKKARVAGFVSLAATWLGAIPVPAQALLGPVAAVLPVPAFNLVCTNVPGPQFPVYLMGHELLTYYPYVPIGNDMGVSCGIQSYNGKLYFGLAGDTAAVPDLQRLSNYIASSFSELRRLAGVSARKQATRLPALIPKLVQMRQPRGCGVEEIASAA